MRKSQTCRENRRRNRQTVGQHPGCAALAVITTKSVCIKKDADENEAMRLKEEFEAAGAEVEFVPLAAPGTQGQSEKDDDDKEEPEGRTLTESEYVSKLNGRNDIFSLEKDHRLRNIEAVLLVVGILLGVWITKHEMIQVASDFYEKIPDQVTAKLVKGDELPATLQQKKEDEKKKEDIKTDKKTLKPSKAKGAGGTFGGGGDPRARVTQKGVLGIISGKVSGKAVASADIFGKGGLPAISTAFYRVSAGLRQAEAAVLEEKALPVSVLERAMEAASAAAAETSMTLSADFSAAPANRDWPSNKLRTKASLKFRNLSSLKAGP